jgi:hypothetical protein
MSFELTIDNRLVTHDLSNAGYGCRLCDAWHRVTPSHNTIVVDGKDHRNISSRGKILKYDSNTIQVACDEVYEGIDFERVFQIYENHFEDTFNVISKDEHIYDLFLHIDGVISLEKLHLAEGTLDIDNNVYSSIRNIKKVVNNKVLDFIVDDVKGTIYIDTDCEIYLCETLNNPVTKYRQSIVLRKKGKQEFFKLRWEF